MENFVKIDPMELPGNAISLFHEGWALLTAGDKADYNTMTISWGELGCLWNLPVCTVFVRPCRYTYGYMEKNNSYTVCLFDKTEHRQALGLLGSKSGRDMDKVAASGMTPIEVDGLMAFEEARAILVIDKLYDVQFDAARVPAEIMGTNYKTVAPDDLHRIYFGKIKAAYLRK